MTKNTLKGLEALKALASKEALSEVTPAKASESAKISFDPKGKTLKMRLEKNQRGGKMVTVIFNMPYERAYFETLTKELKNKVGSGGTLKEEITDTKAILEIEIQGDHRDRLEKILTEKGFKIVRAGG
jgi:translation initiation factor 1